MHIPPPDMIETLTPTPWRLMLLLRGPTKNSEDLAMKITYRICRNNFDMLWLSNSLSVNFAVFH